MTRSVILREDRQKKVQDRLYGIFYSQQDFAEDLKIASSTVSNFVNLKPVDRKIFIQICEKLSLDWREYAVIPEQQDSEENRKSEEPTKLIKPGTTSLTTLEYPEGEVPLNSHFYIQRFPIEQRCYEEISKPGSLIRIKASQQTGKSSLLARILEQAKSQGDTSVTVDFQFAELEFITNLSKFLRWFCDNLTLELTKENQEQQERLLSKLDEHWQLAERIGSMKTCKDYFERYLFTEIKQPLTLALEEVDKVFEYPNIYKDFFGLLRSLHEEAKRRDIWKKLRLVIVHSTEAYVPMNINQSPFNVGLAVELPVFTHDQVEDLAQRHQLDWSNTEVESLITMLGGQPFLVRLALYKIANQEITLDQLLETAATTTGIYSNYLRRIESILEQHPELEAGIKEVIANRPQTQLNKKTLSKLNALGLVKIQGGEVLPSCELYLRYFQNFSN